jgi:hypothetical protein
MSAIVAKVQYPGDDCIKPPSARGAVVWSYNPLISRWAETELNSPESHTVTLGLGLLASMS